MIFIPAKIWLYNLLKQESIANHFNALGEFAERAMEPTLQIQVGWYNDIEYWQCSLEQFGTFVPPF